MIKLVRLWTFSRRKTVQASVQQLCRLSSMPKNFSQFQEPVIIPSLKEAVAFPRPKINANYDQVMRRCFAWAFQYIETNDDMKKVIGANMPYNACCILAHAEDQDFLYLVARLMTFMHYAFESEIQRGNSESKGRLLRDVLELTARAAFLTDNQMKKYPLIYQMGYDAYNDFRNYMTWARIWSFYRRVDIMKFFGDNTMSKTTMSLDDYLLKRPKHYMHDYSLSLPEISLDKSLPRAWMNDKDVKLMNKICLDLLWAVEDLVSFDRQRRQDCHWNNFITVYANEKEVPLQKGVEALIKFIDNNIVGYQTQSWKLSQTTMVQENPQFKQYLEVAFPNFIYGTLQWTDVTGYFQEDGLFKENEPIDRGAAIDRKQLYERVNFEEFYVIS